MHFQKPSTVLSMVVVLCLGVSLEAQPAGVSSNIVSSNTVKVPASGARLTDAQYVLGADDQISIWVLASDEISGKTFTIDQGGDVSLPLVGRMKAAGFTVEQFEKELAKKLSTIIRQPQVAVSVTDFRSQPISVIGAVTTPGSQQLKGRKTLLDALTAAGGLKPEAGSVAKISRRLDYGRIPLNSATDDPAGQFSVAEVNLKSLLATENSKENFELRPFDVISVSQAQLVYLVGEISRPGIFPVNDNEHLTILQVISMAGGLTKMASAGKTKILRPVMGGPKRAELAIDLKRILAGKTPDQPLLPNDILFVPDSAGKRFTYRAVEEAIRMSSLLFTVGSFSR